ncbi:hypothetical protein G5I_03564 [Acromyrmex echinatior]|uniref:Uncharacterized protein n=1 Tax=Acromyrmex echinatior TaxID=103372 RepID=F4WDB1_ACREC|nr:hypothetical protein G5I_03564 [Acromyrmex echinatior]
MLRRPWRRFYEDLVSSKCLSRRRGNSSVPATIEPMVKLLFTSLIQNPFEIGYEVGFTRERDNTKAVFRLDKYETTFCTFMKFVVLDFILKKFNFTSTKKESKEYNNDITYANMRAEKRGCTNVTRRDATRRDATRHAVAVRTLRIVSYGSISLTKVKTTSACVFYEYQLYVKLLLLSFSSDALDHDKYMIKPLLALYLQRLPLRHCPFDRDYGATVRTESPQKTYVRVLRPCEYGPSRDGPKGATEFAIRNRCDDVVWVLQNESFASRRVASRRIGRLLRTSVYYINASWKVRKYTTARGRYGRLDPFSGLPKGSRTCFDQSFLHGSLSVERPSPIALCLPHVIADKRARHCHPSRPRERRSRLSLGA